MKRRRCQVTWGSPETRCAERGTWAIEFSLSCQCLPAAERFYCDQHKAAMLDGTRFLCPVCAEMKVPVVSSLADITAGAA